MIRIQELERKVKNLYTTKNPERDEWADWLWDNHVLVVANYASDLAKRYDANQELARAAALLHDIADTARKRKDPNHEEDSLEIGRNLMVETGYTEDEISVVIDDAARYHSCHDGERPKSLEGKVLATADSLAHFKTDFYIFAAWGFGHDRPYADLKQWVLNKLDHGLNNKIFFDEVRGEVKPDYELLKTLFSR